LVIVTVISQRTVTVPVYVLVRATIRSLPLLVTGFLNPIKPGFYQVGDVNVGSSGITDFDPVVES